MLPAYRLLLTCISLFLAASIAAQPTITSFSPATGKPGDAITITGTNLNTTAASNLVYFGATKATVSSATATSLSVTIPAGATYAPVTIINLGTVLAYQSNNKFTPTYSPAKTTIATSDFAPKTDFAHGNTMNSLALGDFDGDGKTDMAVPVTGSSAVSVYRNTGNNGLINFATKVDFGVSTSPNFLAIGDIDMDGKPDIVAANTNNATISVLRNTSTGVGNISFATHILYTTNSFPAELAIADFDGDGKPDIAVANAGSDNVSIFRNTTTGSTISFASKVDYSAANYGRISVGDVDGDGKADIATPSFNGSTINVLRNTGSSGTISFATAVSFNTDGNPTNITMGDIDGDGKPDVAVTCLNSYVISVLRNTSTSGTVSFDTKLTYANGNYQRSITMADADGDGKADLVISNQSTGTAAAIFRNTSSSGSISFATRADISVGYTTCIYALMGDIDGDAKPDLIVCTTTNFISVLRNVYASPTITSFTPTNAKPGDAITLTGTNFNTTAANNTVAFGATTVTPSAATASSLTVTLPVGASYTQVSALNTATALSGSSRIKFTPTFSPPKAAITTGDFATPIDVSNTSAFKNVMIADFDGDGKPDMAGCYNSVALIGVLRNTGSLGNFTFATPVTFASINSAVNIAVGDIDMDGKPDIAIANGTTNSISVFRNTSIVGSISFAARVDYATTSNTQGIAIGDIDMDGRPDMVASCTGSNTLNIFRNTGSTGIVSFASFISASTGSSPLSVAIGDIDMDGKNDIVVANNGSNSLSVFINQSTNSNIVVAAKADFSTGGSPLMVAIGDIDGDGKNDLSTSIAGSVVSVLRSTSSTGVATFAAYQFFTTNYYCYGLTLADIDGDGKPDIAAANSFSDGKLSLLRNTSVSGTISFAAKADITVAASGNPITVQVNDMDGDKKPDLVATINNVTYLLQNIYQAPTIIAVSPTSAKAGDAITVTGTNFSSTIADNAVFFGGAKATVTAATTTTLNITLPIGSSYAPVSVTNAGTNLAASSSNSFNPVYSPPKANITANDFATQADFSVGSLSRNIVTADMDGDSKADVLVSYNIGSNVSILRNTSTIGTTSFATRQTFSTGTSTSPNCIATGDVDMDGKLDMVVANFASGINYISVFRNTSTVGSISFATRIDLPSGARPYWVAIADVDGDGKPDIVCTNSADNTVSVFRNLSSAAGTISFATKMDFAVGSFPYGVAVADVDGDGKPDIAATNYSGSSVSVLRNTSSVGNVSFVAAVNFTTPNNPSSVALADFDGDGKLDMATSNVTANNFSIFKNTSTSGTISFDTRIDIAGLTSPLTVAIGDVNGDSKPDLLGAESNGATGGASIFRNTSSSGSISLAARVDFLNVAGNYIYGVALCDIDGDGKPDFLANNAQGTNMMSVFRCIYPAPTITALSSNSAVPGTSITLTGTGFAASTTDNLINFGATKATVTAVTETTLTATVPASATYAPISLVMNGTNVSASSTAYFNPIYSPAKTSIVSNEFDVRTDISLTTYGQDVLFSDLDGDGKPDMLNSYQNSGAGVNIAAYRNTGSVGSFSFAARQNFTVGNNFGYAIAVADIDMDGKPDVVSVNNASNSFSVLRNTSTVGSINFATKVDVTTGTGPIGVAIGDLDGDGKPDIAITNYTANTITAYRNLSTAGNISFSSAYTFTLNTNPMGIAIGDVDGDGKLDMMAVNRSNDNVSVFRNTSTIGIITMAAKVDFATGTSPISIALADVNGDGKLDIATANNGSNTVSILRNTGSSGTLGFDTKVDFSKSSVNNVNKLAFGDIDGDCKPDMAVTYQTNGNYVAVYKNTSSGSTINFATAIDLNATSGGGSGIAIADIDGDAKPDVACINNGTNYYISLFRNIYPTPSITTVSPLQAKPGDAVTLTGSNFGGSIANNKVFFGGVQATLTAATATSITATLPLGASYNNVSVLNAATNLFGYSNSQHSPTFTPAKSTVDGGDFDVALNTSIPYQIQDIAATDLDGDGMNDIITANSGSANISVYRNTGSSGNISLATRADFNAGSSPISIATGDFDMDGKPDIVVANYASSTISVFKNNSTLGSISLSAKTDYTTGAQPYSVTVADIDADGRPDMLVANYNTNTFSVFRNTSTVGSISFAAKVDYNTSTNNPTTIATGDIDGDGKRDIIVGHGGYVSVFINYSTPSNDIAIAYTGVSTNLGVTVTGIAVGDIDGDGKADVMAKLAYSNSYITALRNTSTVGNVSFAVSNVNSGDKVSDITITDMNGDGKADVVLTNSLNSNLTFLRNTSTSGNLSFAGFTTMFINTTNLSSLVCADMDNDGRVDIVYGNTNSPFSLGAVRNNPAYTWYSKASGAANLQTLASWGFNADGSGNNPVDFANSKQTYQLANGAGNSYGISSSLTLGGTLIVPTNATLNMGSNNLIVSKNLTNNGSITGTGTLTLNGTNNLISGVGSISNLELTSSNYTSINSVSSSITITNSYTPTSGILYTNNSLILASNATNTARIATSTGGSFNGDVTVQRFIQGGNSNGTPGRRGFRFLSHPFAYDLPLTPLRATGNIDITGNGGAANGFDPTLLNNPSAFWYNPTALNAGNASTVGSGASNDAGWQAFTYGNGTADGSNPNAWKQGAGIRVLFRGAKGEGLTGSGNYVASNVTLSLTGQVNIFNQSFALPASGNDQWSLVGNPYPSPINIRSLLYTQRNAGLMIGATAYVFNPNKTGTARGGYDAIDISNAGNYVLPIYGVVLVQNKQATANTISFAETDKTGNAIDVGFRTQRQGTTIGIDLVDAATQEVLDDYNLRFDNTALLGTIGDAKDGGKLLNNYAIYSIAEGDNKMLKVDSRPQPTATESIVRLGLYSGEAKSFILKITDVNLPMNTTAYLKDKWLNVEQAITNTNYTYSFATTTDTASQGNNRFELVFKTNGALPVTFTIIKATQQGIGINVEWNVANEQNLNSYEVEESVDGITFTKATTQLAQNKTTYTWYDAQVNNGNNYYRIKAINKDGSSQYSQVVNVKLGKGLSEFTIYPNPIKNSIINLQLSNVEKGSYTIKLYNNAGQELLAKTIQHIGGSGTQIINLGTAVAKGSYQMVISNGTTNTTKTIVVE
jgi:FG-GAP-like repeat/IPT/TIG domain/Secretion system C-terminal sorting domain